MLYDTAAFVGNGDGDVDELELGRMTSVDDIINAAGEVSSVDSITVTLHIAEVAGLGSGRRLLLGDYSSGLIHAQDSAAHQGQRDSQRS